MEILPYGGWQRCARIQAGSTEAIVTLEVGPRVIRYGLTGGPNELVEYPDEMGRTGGDEYRSYGGHRLWIAPEEFPKTYHPENGPVEAFEEDGWYVFRPALDPWMAQKEVRIKPEGEALRLEHRIYNKGAYPLLLAPWVLTVMAAGGVCVFPQAAFVSHKEKVLPARPLVLWNYTDMSDPRWTWGNRLVRFAQHADKGSQKVGTFVDQGWAAYANHGNLFFKRFSTSPTGEYPDFGCNFETYSREDMLEVESLGAMQSVAPGAYAVHTETWYLGANVTLPEDDGACADMLEAFAGSRPLL